MPTVQPYIPERITVHLGAPSSGAENVTVDYLEYLKNVAAGEIYPTWEVSSLRANILAINSYALNRVYTEYYRSRGYDFEITSTTAYDQSFELGRATFENVNQLVDELFDTYIRRQTFVEPLAAKFCNGTTSRCDGLSQWGSQSLAEQGYNSIQILQAYYGDDIELVSGAKVQSIMPSYPGEVLKLGSIGDDVTVVQTSLNRISQNYPLIPKITPVDGFFRESTDRAVRAFQNIFNLEVDGIVGKATWYEIVHIYVSVKRLAELQSEGQTFYGISWTYPDEIREGERSAAVSHLQYMLAVLGAFYESIPAPPLSGVFGEDTKASVLAFQSVYQLPETGIVDRETWNSIYNAFQAIEETVLRDPALFPLPPVTEAGDIRQVQKQLQTVSAAFAQIPPALTGQYDRRTRSTLVKLQRAKHLPVSGKADHATRLSLAASADDLAHTDTTRRYQFPGYDLGFGQRDPDLDPNHRMNCRMFYIGRPITVLQEMLRALSHTSDSIPFVIPDGVYTEDTMEAVSAFQREKGLPVTGITNFGTWCAILDAYDELERSEKRSACKPAE